MGIKSELSLPDLRSISKSLYHQACVCPACFNFCPTHILQIPGMPKFPVSRRGQAPPHLCICICHFVFPFLFCCYGKFLSFFFRTCGLPWTELKGVPLVLCTYLSNHCRVEISYYHLLSFVTTYYHTPTHRM